MAKRIAPIRVISFLLLAACAAWCQMESADLGQGLQLDASNPPEAQNRETRARRSLPDAPSTVQPPKQAQKFQTCVDEVCPPLALEPVDINLGVVRGIEVRHVTPGPRPGYMAPHNAEVSQEEFRTFFDRYLYPSSLEQNVRYHPSSGGGLVGRATYAASRIFIMRDNSGKGRLNTSYFLWALTSVAVSTAYRPYWARSSSATFNNFGSTIGSDAGKNLFHEFGPGILQMVKGHTPRFASRIGDRITNQTPREVVSTPVGR